MPSTCRSGLLEDHAERSSSRIIRPASRDRSEDARSGNTHQSVHQTKAKAFEQRTILDDTGFSFSKPILFAHAQRGAEPPVRINLLFTMYAEQALFPYGKRKPFFLQKTIQSPQMRHPTGPEDHADRSAARPERSGVSRDSVRTNNWWS